MSFLTWLFPDADMARREALARIDGLRRQYDEIDEAESPMRRIASEVFPLFKAADLAAMPLDGRILFLTKEDIVNIETAMITAALLRGQIPPRDRSFHLFGAKVSEGTERRLSQGHA
jgi:hypothetical protein